MPNFVAWRAKQCKTRRGNQREDNQRVEEKEAREMEMEGGGALGAFFFSFSIFDPLNISYKK